MFGPGARASLTLRPLPERLSAFGWHDRLLCRLINRMTTAPASDSPASRPTRTDPVLDRLAQVYPALFGSEPKPLKRGIFEDLLQRHDGDGWTSDALKATLRQHTRSTRYLNAVASGQARHDLDGTPVEMVAPEQRFHALVEVHRRRQARAPRDLTPQLKRRIAQIFEASGLGVEAFSVLVNGRDEALNQLTREVIEATNAQQAREAAWLRAFEAGTAPLETFAAAHGMPAQQARDALDRAKSRRAAAQQRQAGVVNTVSTPV